MVVLRHGAVGAARRDGPLRGAEAGARRGAAGSADNYEYGFFSGTSSSAPGVAGCAVLFKQWYLHHHGADTANQYGRLMSNLLNMADGFATDQRARGGKRVPVPAATWGLGRFRMRLYANEGMSSPWFRATKAVTLTHAGDHDIFDLGHPDTLEVPRGRHRGGRGRGRTTRGG